MSDDIYGTAPAKTMEANTTHSLSPPPTVLPVPFYTLLLYLPQNCMDSSSRHRNIRTPRTPIPFRAHNLVRCRTERIVIQTMRSIRIVMVRRGHCPARALVQSD
jgi:hypothetical protein